VAAKARKHPRTVSSKVATIRALPEDVRDMLRGTPVADSQHDLRELAKEHPDVQRELAQLIASGAATTLKIARKKLRQLPGESLRDETRAPVPPRVTLAMTELPNTITPLHRQARRLRSDLKKARKATAKAWEQAGADAATRGGAQDDVLARLEKTISSVADQLSYMIPAVVCPACVGAGLGAKGAPTCAECRGKGWLTRGHYETWRKRAEGA
jgi:hypothetical protein